MTDDIVPPKEEPKPKEKVTKAAKKLLQSVKGMKDILPQEQKYWTRLYNALSRQAKAYGFQYIETPVLESPALFLKSLSKKNNIIDNLFAFKTEQGEALCLRPELSLPILRAYVEHALYQSASTVKIYSCGPVFRQEESKFVESRQLHQGGLYIIGESSYITDAQVVLALYALLKDIFDKSDIKLQVRANSVGCANCREHYKEALLGFYKGKKKLLCENCQEEVGKFPLYILNCEETCCCELKADAPQAVDWLCEPCKTHFMKLLECFDEVDIPYLLDPYIVSGFDLSAQTVFEISAEENRKGSAKPVALASGGRHNEIAKKLGGIDIPLVGGGFIFENLIKKVKQWQNEADETNKTDIFVVQLGDMAKKKALYLFEALRLAGIGVAENFAKDHLKSQFELAAKSGAKFSLVIGQQEVIDGTVIIRDMESGVQEMVDFNKAVAEMKKRLMKLK